MTKSSLPALLVIGGIVLWLLTNPLDTLFQRSQEEPRSVAARGDLAADERNTIDIFKANSPSVVYVTSLAVRRNFFSLNAVEIPQGTGSGFIWDNKGRIVTNYHVISEASKVEVTMADQSTWRAVVIGAAPDKDLAVLQIDAPASRLRPIAVGSSVDLQVGQKVFAIGNPFGLDQTITSGIISALNREITSVTGRSIRGMIQTDAAINPGNSGGPLLDSAGRLIGVNTAIYSPSGAYAGIGFAVAVDLVNTVVPEIIQHGREVRAGIGVSLADDRITRRLGIDGVLILGVERGGPAAQAGLQPTSERRGEIVLGDIIVAVAGKSVSSYSDFRDVLEGYKVGDEVQVTIIRSGRRLEVPVRLSLLD